MGINKMQYRKLNKEDFKEASKLVWEVFSEFEAPEYSREGILTFKEFIEPNKLYANSLNGYMNFWGCFAEEDIVGVIASRDKSHISLLFVKKEYQHKGIAKELFNKLKTECIKNSPCIESITVNSSPYAVRIYERIGFKATDKEQLQDGIRFTPMKFEIKK